LKRAVSGSVSDITGLLIRKRET